MASPRTILLLTVVATAAFIAYSSAVHDVKAASTESSEAEQKHEGNEEESWTGWAKEKLTEGLGIKPQAQTDEVEVGSKVGEGVKTTREKAQNLPSEKGSVAEEKAKKAKEESKTAAEKLKEKTGETKEATEKTAEEGSWKAKEGYEAAKTKAAETLDAAKEKVVGGSNKKDGEL